MTETVSAAVAKRDNSPGAVIEQYRQDFSLVLPTQIKPATWVRLAQGLLRRDRALRDAATRNPGSLMQALLECARLGHEPGTDRFYLVPIKGQIEGWEGYKGVIQRMLRGGQVRNVKAAVVREHDDFRFDPDVMDRPHHKIDWFGDRGKILGSYAYAIMHDGSTSQVAVADQDYIRRVRAMQPNANSASSPWVKWEESMVLKCAFNRLEPFVDASSEDRRLPMPVASTPAEPVVAIASGEPDLPEPAQSSDGDADVVDADVVDDPDTYNEATWAAEVGAE